MISCDGLVVGRSFRKKPYTTSNAHRLWPGIKDDPSVGYRVHGNTEQELPDTDVSSLSSNRFPAGSQTSNRKDSERIYILGLGHYGTLVAHAIAGLPNRPSVTLLLHTMTKLHQWESNDRCTEVLRNKTGEKRRDYSVELLRPDNSTEAAELPGAPNHKDVAEPEIIYQVILSVKPQFTLYALSKITDRLTKDSTILFLQNGMGMVDEVNEKIFPDERTRPTYMVATISHEVATTPLNPFSVNHSNMGTTALGILPRGSMHQVRTVGGLNKVASSALHILRTLTRIPELAAVGFIPTDILQWQLEQVAIKAIIYPLTTLLNCRRGEIFDETHLIRTTRLLLAEISLVIRSLPELQGVANVTMRFSPDRLEAIIRNVCSRSSDETSPMFLDVKDGRVTSINYLNGYIVRRGEELGLRCTMNYLVIQMVQGKGILQRRRDSNELPFQQGQRPYDEVS